MLTFLKKHISILLLLSCLTGYSGIVNASVTQVTEEITHTIGQETLTISKVQKRQILAVSTKEKNLVTLYHLPHTHQLPDSIAVHCDLFLKHEALLL